MRRIVVCLAGVAIALLAASCYQEPQPACGFQCGPESACPPSYSCLADRVCHLDGTSTFTVCPGPDAGVDAAPDAFADPVPPAVVAMVPADGAAGVMVDVAIDARFNEPISNISIFDFAVKLDGTTSLGGSVSYDAGTLTASFAPGFQLPPNRNYTVVLGPEIVDSFHTPLVPPSWSFSTGDDTVPPHLVRSTPANGDTMVATNATITVVFDEPVTGVDMASITVMAGATAITGTVSNGLDPATWIFTPDAALPAASTITVSLSSAIVDSYANALVPLAFSFMTM